MRPSNVIELIRRFGSFFRSVVQITSISIVSIFCVGCWCCVSKPESGKNSTKFDQYFVHGELLYTNNCSNCHQKTGTGLGLLYPPLKGSDYVLKNRNEVICLIKNGKSGELIVNGKSFNQPMPPMPLLTELEIAEIATYIYNSWGNEEGMVEVNEVSQILLKCDSITNNSESKIN